MEKINCAVAICNSHSEAEEAVSELQKSGFDMKKLSIVGRNYRTEEHVVGYYTTGDRMKYWGMIGAFWGGVLGSLFGWAFFWFPGFGPLFAAGPVVSWILAALEAAALGGGLGALSAGLYGMGTSRRSALRYEAEVKADNYLVIAHGSADEIDRARNVLGMIGAHALARHPAGFVTPAASSRGCPMEAPPREKQIQMFGGTDAKK